MKISIIGAGYVGLTYAAGLSHHGFDVNVVDINNEIIEMINRNSYPIDEPGLAEALATAGKKGLLKGFTKLEDVFLSTDLFLICVGTYCDMEGNIDLSQIKAVSRSLRDCYIKFADCGYKTICVKSTVICGTTDGVVRPIIEESGKKVQRDFGLAMSPEFLREGNALNDILHPDKIVIGGIDSRSISMVKKALSVFIKNEGDGNIIETDLRTAELIKYAQNSFLATKISFINEVSRFAELFGVDVGDVADAMGLDSRISRKFLNAGPGFGGSCFPKDVLALYSAGKKAGLDPILLKAVLDVNEKQKEHVMTLIGNAINIKGKKLAILGLSFKGNTGDTRESVSRTIIKRLLEGDVRELRLHDPSTQARIEIKNDFPPSSVISYHDNINEAIVGVDAVIILTDWDNYKQLRPSDLEPTDAKPIIVDARRVIRYRDFEQAGFKVVRLGMSKSRRFVPD
ncbi:MAG: UDP-glucose dehydrogenase family protein [Promethearchaeota archaeon]